jgi:hypothetical protein
LEYVDYEPVIPEEDEREHDILPFDKVRLIPKITEKDKGRRMGHRI